MIYKNIVKGKFISRPNRFIARVLVDGNEEIVHVKNTGRCKELLTDGALVYLQKSDKLERKTKYDLITVLKNGTNLVNMDSQVPNDLVFEYLSEGNLFSKGAKIKREFTNGDSRFDFYVEDGDTKAFVEVKGVTLEENGAYKFPDAPTLRGKKHLKELCYAKSMGYSSYVLFVIQGEGAKSFAPNEEKDPEFSKALRMAKEEGVSILCYECEVGRDFMKISKEVEVEGI